VHNEVPNPGEAAEPAASADSEKPETLVETGVVQDANIGRSDPDCSLAGESSTTDQRANSKAGFSLDRNSAVGSFPDEAAVPESETSQPLGGNGRTVNNEDD